MHIRVQTTFKIIALVMCLISVFAFARPLITFAELPKFFTGMYVTYEVHGKILDKYEDKIAFTIEYLVNYTVPDLNETTMTVEVNTEIKNLSGEIPEEISVYLSFPNESKTVIIHRNLKSSDTSFYLNETAMDVNLRTGPIIIQARNEVFQTKLGPIDCYYYYNRDIHSQPPPIPVENWDLYFDKNTGLLINGRKDFHYSSGYHLDFNQDIIKTNAELRQSTPFWAYIVILTSIISSVIIVTFYYLQRRRKEIAQVEEPPISFDLLDTR